MDLRKTSWLSWKKHHISSTKKQRFKYLPNKEKIYRLKNSLTIILDKINFDSWKRAYSLQAIDILWNSFIIYLVIVFWNQGNNYLKGLSITLLFILVISYLKDIKKVFNK